MIFNLTSGGGANSAFANICVEYPAGSTCTCSNGTRTYTARDTLGYAIFGISSAGTWTVTATNGTDTTSEEVTIETEGTFKVVELAYRVPSGYVEVQYLGSDGTAFVDTGYYPKSTTTMELTKAKILSGASGYGMFFHCGDGFGLGTREYTTEVRYVAPPTTDMYVGALTVDSFHNIKFDGSQVLVDDVVKLSNCPAPGNATSYSGYLFCWHETSAHHFLKSQLGEILVYESGVLVRDFVPCKNSETGVGYFYDKIGRTFCENHGTLVVGPEVA